MKLIPVNSSEAVRTYAFMACLAAQEYTGTTAAGPTTASVLAALSSTTSGFTRLYALVDEDCGENDTAETPFVHAWLEIYFPTDQNTTLTELTITFDVTLLPLPGEPLSDSARRVAKELFTHAERISRQHNRTRLELWTHGGLGEEFVTHFGFVEVTRETCVAVPVTAGASVSLPQGMTVVDGTERPAEEVAAFLTEIATDMPTGDSQAEATMWTAELLTTHRQEQAAAGVLSLETLLLDEQTKKPLALSFTTHDSHADPTAARTVATGVARGHRGRGLATAVKTAALREVAKKWPTVTAVYTTVHPCNAPMNRVNESLGAVPHGSFVCLAKDLVF